jgi:hypothetical protein
VTDPSQPLLSVEQRSALDTVRERVRSPDFGPPRDRESLNAWASHRGHGPLGALMSTVFDAGGRLPFPWELFGDASPFFEEPEGDFGESALVLLDGEPPEVGEPQVAQRAVVLRLDLDELRGRDGLCELVDRVEEALLALLTDQLPPPATPPAPISSGARPEAPAHPVR